MKVGIVGSGTWGTALSILLNKNGNDVTLWSFSKDEVSELSSTRKHPNLKDAVIDEKILITDNIEECLKDKEVIVVVVPSSFMRENIERIKPYVKENQIIVNCSKGIEDNTLMTMTDIISDVLPKNVVATLSGPSHAEEVALGIATTCTIATESKDIAIKLQDLFSNEKFRVYINPDLLGVELGGSLKNIIALAAGVCDGMGFGDNAKAALITRGLVEIARLGTAMGADFRTFYGLSGLGDLIVTCNSMHSRNRRCGILLGQGKSLEEAKKEIGMVVEGVASAKAGFELSKKFNIEAPIISSMNNILFGESSAKYEALELMTRTRKAEFEEEASLFNVIRWEGEKNVCR